MKAIAHKIVPIRIGLERKILKKIASCIHNKVKRTTGSRINVQLVEELLNNEKR